MKNRTAKSRISAALSYRLMYNINGNYYSNNIRSLNDIVSFFIDLFLNLSTKYALSYLDSSNEHKNIVSLQP